MIIKCLYGLRILNRIPNPRTVIERRCGEFVRRLDVMRELHPTNCTFTAEEFKGRFCHLPNVESSDTSITTSSHHHIRISIAPIAAQ